MATSLVNYTTIGIDNTSSGTISIPSGVVDGDVLIMFIAKDGTSSPSVPTFTQQYNAAPSGSSSRDALFWKPALAEPSSYIVNLGGNERAWVCLAAFREVDNVSPFESFNSYANNALDSTMEVPQITRSVANQMCVAFMGIDSGNSGNPLNPTWSGGGWTTESDNQSGPTGTGGGSAAGAFATQQTTSTGSLGPSSYSYGGGNSRGSTLAFALKEGAPPEIGIISVDKKIVVGQTDVNITGFGFEAVQGSGKVEIGDNIDYALATLVSQNIVSWSDDTITYDVTGLNIFPDGELFLFVTDDDGNRASSNLVFGIPSYDLIISESAPDHWWTFDNTYSDFAGANPFTSFSDGTNGFASVVLSEGVSQSWRTQGGRRECPNSGNMNTVTTSNRLMGGWIRLGGIQKGFSCLYEEGGGVNNLAFFLGLNNTLVAQQADTGDDNVQAFSDVSLEPNRNYHILFKFSYTDGTNKFSLFVDGIEQQSTSGNPITSGDLDAHSGDISLGGPGGNLEVGGTDVRFVNQEDTYYSNWVTYSEETGQGLIDDLFRRGAVPSYIITEDTQANMQAQLDALTGTVAENDPLTIRIEKSTSAGELFLDLNNFTFNALSTIHLEYRGIEPLTITNLSGSNLTLEKTFATQGATISVQNPAQLSLNGLQPNSEVRVYEAGTQTEVAGVELSGTTEVFDLIGIASVDIVVFNVQYEYLRIDNVNTISNVSLPIQQQFDRNYVNP